MSSSFHMNYWIWQYPLLSIHSTLWVNRIWVNEIDKYKWGNNKARRNKIGVEQRSNLALTFDKFLRTISFVNWFIPAVVIFVSHAATVMFLFMSFFFFYPRPVLSNKIHSTTECRSYCYSLVPHCACCSSRYCLLVWRTIWRGSIRQPECYQSVSR